MKSKKELKDSYKEMKSKIGVFQIRNTVNHKIYIASSIDLVAIWNKHRFHLNNRLHLNINLQKEGDEFGQDNFIYEILCEIKQDNPKTLDCYRKEAMQLETMFIEDLQPFGDRGYNKKKAII